MKIETKSNQFQNALAKAIEKKPFVRPVAGDASKYLVRGSNGDFYQVNFVRASGGAMLGYCHCAGAMRGYHCYHLAAALMVHSAYVRAGIRRPAARREMSPPSWSGSDEMRAYV